MGSRYIRTFNVDNNTELYDFLRQKRGNLKNIRHQETPVMKNPTVSERAMIDSAGHIWKYGDRYYNLAYKYYGDSEYWWVIAWYNGRMTEADISPGVYIEIPLNLEQALMILGVY